MNMPLLPKISTKNLERDKELIIHYKKLNKIKDEMNTNVIQNTITEKAK